VTASSSTKAADFVESVLRLEPRLAVFDCDGTLWAGDAGEGFFSWELIQGVVSEEIARWARPRYADYRAGKVDEDTMCGEMVTIHRGLSEQAVLSAAAEYFDSEFVQQVFPEMRDLVNRLQQAGCEVWAVSSTNEWIIKAAMKHFGIAPDKVLAAAVEIENGIVTDRLIRVPTGEGKPKAIQDRIGRTPDVAFGNSRWDVEMLGVARHPFAVNPNSDLAVIAREKDWPVYWPKSIRRS